MAPHDGYVANSGETPPRAQSQREGHCPADRTLATGSCYGLLLRALATGLQYRSNMAAKQREANEANRNDSLSLRVAVKLPRNYVKFAKKARPGGREPPSPTPLPRGKEPANLAGDRVHAVAELFPAVAGLEQLVRDLERRQNRCFVRFHGRTGVHDPANHLVDVLRNGARMLGWLFAPDRVLLADDRHLDRRLAAHRCASVSCCWRRKRSFSR